MPEAVIVDAVRTPDRTGRQGLAEIGPRRRARGGAAEGTARAQPVSGDGRLDRRRDDGLRLRRGRVRLQHRPQRGAAGWDRPPRPGDDRQPLLRLLAADDADGLPRDQGGRGRHLRGRRRRGRLAGRQRRRLPVPPAARRLGELALQRLHPDGADGRERRRALQASAARRRTSGPRCPSSAPSPLRSPVTSTRRSSA